MGSGMPESAWLHQPGEDKKGGKITMKTDAELQRDVMNELRWEPTIKAAEIGVGVKGGVVTLSGHVDSYVKKWAAGRAAARVSGVRAVAEKSRSACPALLSVQMRRSPGRWQMFSSGTSWCPMTVSKCRCKTGWLP